MSNLTTHESEETRARHKMASEQSSQEPVLDAIGHVNAAHLVSELGHTARGNGGLRADAMQRMQQTHGNRAVQRYVQQSSARHNPEGESRGLNVQRAIWNGNDLENDFWGTKELLGDRWGGVVDAGLGAAWNFAGAVPGAGTFISLGGSIIDSGKSIASSISGNRGAAEHFHNDAIASAVSAIPIWGTGQGVVGGLWDAANMVERIADPSAKKAPLSSDILDEALEY